MGNFYVETIQRDSRFHSVSAINDMALLEPGFRAKVEAVMADAKAKGIELVVTETYRSSERQQSLYAQGKTQLRTVGVHHYGLAVDFAKRLNGQLSWDGDWGFLAQLGAAHGIYPSPLASDLDHLQGVTKDQQARLFAGAWYPGAAAGVGPIAPVPAIVIKAPTLPTPRAPLSPAQAAFLNAADQVNRTYFQGWFWRSSMMAFAEVESAFNPQAFRQEPSGVASYGAMQVLDVTAAGLGLGGDPEQMYDLSTGIFYGLKYAAQGWNYLLTHLGRPPTLVEWCEGYNCGYGAAVQGRRDPDYSDKWIPAQKRWAAIVDAA